MYASILYGGITHHYVASKLPYCNRINNVGSIHNEYVIGLVGSKNYKAGFIKGKDSACGDIFGAVGSVNISEYADLIVGAYNTNFKEFRKIGIEPVHFGSLTPIAGIDFKIPVYESKEFSIAIDNLVSYGIITHSVSISF